MKTIKVGSTVAYVDDEDYDKIVAHTWQLSERSYTDYAFTKVNGKTVYMHQLVLPPITGMDTDHINGVGLINTKANLRYATRSQNMHNGLKHRKNQGAFRGVRHHHSGDNPWQARIMINRKNHTLGYFSTAELANQAILQYKKERGL